VTASAAIDMRSLALMNGPAPADKPTCNLDPTGVTRMMDLIGRINPEEGTILLMSVQDDTMAILGRRQRRVRDGIVTG
jgi:predicted ABC-type transport system involved in lysophospholipase L1 biosynthesis ATPase subunit